MTWLRAVVVSSLALSGCASTSGHEWLNSPVEQQAVQTTQSTLPTDAATDYRPRLSHTVTLGESYEVATAPSLLGDPSAPTVQVNVSTPVIVNNLGGYGYGYGSAYGYGRSSYNYGSVGAARTTTRSAPAPKVGADFPAPPDLRPARPPLAGRVTFAIGNGRRKSRRANPQRRPWAKASRGSRCA